MQRVEFPAPSVERYWVWAFVSMSVGMVFMGHLCDGLRADNAALKLDLQDSRAACGVLESRLDAEHRQALSEQDQGLMMISPMTRPVPPVSSDYNVASLRPGQYGWIADWSLCQIGGSPAVDSEALVGDIREPGMVKIVRHADGALHVYPIQPRSKLVPWTPALVEGAVVFHWPDGSVSKVTYRVVHPVPAPGSAADRVISDQ